MSKFNGVIGAEPVFIPPLRPTTEQVAAIGRALPKGKHMLSAAQQHTWLGGVIFHEPVEWKDGKFVSGELALTPRQVVMRARP